ncbi:MAG: hypothetical protein WBO29_01790 [Albidovulum sp.]
MTNDKAALKHRILTNDTLSDEHAYIGAMLLTIARDDPPAYRVSTWVAQEMFQVDETEWRTALDALAVAGLVAVAWESPTRATITFIPEGQ